MEIFGENYNIVERNILKSMQKGIFSRFGRKKGVYVYGDTGTGKTTMMHTLYKKYFETGCELSGRGVNMHFHDYFTSISRLLSVRNYSEIVSQVINKGVSHIFFDEFFLDNITDAVIFRDLYKASLEGGLILYITSNFHPENLFRSGFNRHLVFPELSNLVDKNMQMVHIESKIDYRLSKIDTNNNFFATDKFTENPQKTYEFDFLFKKFHGIKYYFQVLDSDIIYINHCAPFTGEDIGIRIRNFIDIAYVRGVEVKMHSSMQKVEDIFPVALRENMLYKRTISRLYEMLSPSYAINPDRNLKMVWSKHARHFFETLFD